MNECKTCYYWEKLKEPDEKTGACHALGEGGFPGADLGTKYGDAMIYTDQKFGCIHHAEINQ